MGYLVIFGFFHFRSKMNFYITPKRLFFCNTWLLASPISRRPIAAISAANRQSGVEDGCYREKFQNFIAWAEPDPKRHFSRFTVPFDYPEHSLQKTVLPQSKNHMLYRWKAETLTVCLLPVRRVCDQAFVNTSFYSYNYFFTYPSLLSWRYQLDSTLKYFLGCFFTKILWEAGLHHSVKCSNS